MWIRKWPTTGVWIGRLATIAVLTVALALPMVPASAGSGGDDSDRSSNSLIVRTDDGLVRGGRTPGVDNFLGIPYAAPPVRELRWRPPQPVRDWSGVRSATDYGTGCPALANTNGPQTVDEDCLFVNVQRPAGTRREAALPVYVFLHGGGGVNGSSTQHDGSKFVREGRIMVVTLNYRLGVFGSLGLPELTAKQGESGNYGFQDQRAGLRWVQANIARFGGDPARVTVGGESFGAASVCYHLSAPPLTERLFSGAIIQSMPTCFAHPQSEAEARGQQIAGAVGCTDAATALRCLRTADTEQLLRAAEESQIDTSIVIGTKTMPGDPRQAVADGNIRRVPVLIGTNLDEERTFLQPSPGNPLITEANYEQWVPEIFGSTGAEVLDRYPWPAVAEDYTGNYLFAAIFTDSFWACQNRRFAADFAKSRPTWLYEFAHRDGPGLIVIPDYVWGAGHAAELPYLWPSFDNGTPIAPTFTSAERRLAGQMVGYWSAFVKRGDPSVHRQQRWAPLADGNTLLSLDVGRGLQPLTVDEFRINHQCAFWDTQPVP